MKKKITITIGMDDLKAKIEKGRLLNLRIDENLYKRFKSLCEKELNQGMSDVMRKLITELCLQLDYL